MSDTPSRASMPVRLYLLLITIGRWFSCALLLGMRLIWGYQFFLTGKGKLGDLDKVAGYFQSLNIPMPKLNAALAGGTECFGGLLLLAGLGGRLVALPLIFTMCVAYATAERDSLQNLDAFVRAAPFPFLLTALVVFAFGPGLVSIDGLLKYTVFRKRLQPTA
jgi:putative oxidoreductase